MYPTYLAHYGIKGMKWGVRRYQNKDGSLTAAGKKRYSEDFNTAYNLKRKGPDQLSNNELRKLNERMQLEQNYRKLNPTAIEQGIKIVGTLSGLIGGIGAIYSARNSEWFTAGKALIESQLRRQRGSYTYYTYS